jgi:uncharacterized membrane protein
MDTNPYYRAPESQLLNPSGGRSGGSVEEALAGTIQWTVGDIISEAWKNLSGFKGTYWLAMLGYFAVMLAFVAAQFAVMQVADSMALYTILEIASNIVAAPMFVGLMMIGVYRAAGREVSPGMVFSYFPRTLPIVLLNIVMVVMVIIGILLLVLPGIYLAIAYGLCFPLLVEKRMGVWEALETSRKAISKSWFRYAGLMLCSLGLLLVGALALGIGLIWMLPLVALILGTVYHRLFGVEAV